MRDKRRTHVCKFCSNSYTKAEHLIRHERSHTGDKPFRCGWCDRTYSRLDSLSRHQQRQNHVSNTGANNETNTTISSTVDENSTGDTSMLISVDSDLNTLQPDITSAFTAETLIDPSLQLTWPDSEGLLQSILSSNLAPWSQNIDILPSQYLFGSPVQSQNEAESPWLTQNDDQQVSNGAHAIRSMTQIISELSANVTSVAESTQLSTAFLEACLHIFFEQFIPIFPVCHRPTFVFRDWTHPLLLNAIALGSLFIGQEINVAKGEILWTLAHTAVATSWHSLIQHQGPYDTVRGVQLMFTALLGQIYAMLSGTAKLRMTAQIFHSLGFYWARQCDMYATRRKFDATQAIAAISIEQQLELWKLWAAEEVQLRGLLGHYILDGLLTYFTGAPTCQRHASNSLRVPCNEKLFNASTPSEWIGGLRSDSSESTTFRQLLLDLFESPQTALTTGIQLSSLATKVVLEGIQSFVTETNSVGGSMVGHPSNTSIRKALGALQTYITTASHFTESERIELMFRWHTICIDSAVNANRLCKALCSQFSVDQTIFGNAKQDQAIDLRQWSCKPQTRRALLHASAVLDLSSNLAMGQAHAVHLPICHFVSAIVYCAFVLGGTNNISIPRILDWAAFMCDTSETGILNGNMARKDLTDYLSPSSATTTSSSMNSKSLLYDTNVFLHRLRQMHHPWGISAGLESILQQLMSKSGI